MNFYKDSAGNTKWTLVVALLLAEAVCAFIGIFIAGYIIGKDAWASLYYALAFAALILMINAVSLAVLRKPILSLMLPKMKL